MLDLTPRNTAASAAALLHQSRGAHDLAGESASVSAMAQATRADEQRMMRMARSSILL